MLINISEIISTSSKSESYDIPLEAEWFYFDGVKCSVHGETPLYMTVSNSGERKVKLSAQMDAVVDIPCSRCLTKVPTTFHIDSECLLDFTADAQDDEADRAAYMEGSQIKKKKFIYYEIFTRFPMKVLCREDCKGICRQCGKNLNEGECGCDRSSPDPRMAAIRDIFKNFKEV